MPTEDSTDADLLEKIICMSSLNFVKIVWTVITGHRPAVDELLNSNANKIRLNSSVYESSHVTGGIPKVAFSYSRMLKV
jgi:hypothetical protein